jgi:benzylsuccinate CoA-transferase BbsF subunit
MGGFWIDCLAAQTAAYAVIAALHHRSRTGEGQYIDLAMNEVMLSLLPEAVMDYTMNQRVRGRMGNRDDILAPHGCYRCQGEDKWVAIAVTNEEEWRALCHALGRKEWLEDERFADQLQRWNNQEELDALITEWTKGRTAHEVMEILQKAGVPAGPSANVDQMVDDPQLRERDFFVEIDHPLMGKGLYASLPIRLSACARGNYSPAPMLGEHNSYVFHELLGMPEEEIARLVEEEVIY